MGKKDPRVDAYIAQSAEFARPILVRLRKVVHAGCPEVQETIKWGFPHFDYKGIMAGMAAFKEHCTFGFWKGSLLVSGDDSGRQDEAMGQFGRLTKLSDLPADATLVRWVRKAADLNDRGVKLPQRSKPRAKNRTLEVPAFFLAAVRKNKRALATFEEFSYSNKKEYVEWVIEAKGEETRARRLATAIEWMADGKPRNWKYIRK